MAKTLPEVKAGDRCPIDGGTMVVDVAQEPDGLIRRHSQNAHSPFVAKRFEESVREKVAEYGLIHKCTTCGYRARFQPADQGSGDQGNGDQGNRGGGARDQGARDQGARGQGATGGGNAARDQGGRFAGRKGQGSNQGDRAQGDQGDRAQGDQGDRDNEAGYREMQDQAQRDNR